MDRCCLSVYNPRKEFALIPHYIPLIWGNISAQVWSATLPAKCFINQIQQSQTDVFLFSAPPHIDPSGAGNGGTYTSKSIEFDEWHNARVRCWDHVGEGDAWGMWRAIVLSSAAGHMAWNEQSEQLAGKFNSANCTHHKCPRGNFNNIWNKPMTQI